MNIKTFLMLKMNAGDADAKDAFLLIDGLERKLAEREASPEWIKAGDGTLHGAIDYWQERAKKAEAELERLKDEREGNTRQFRRLQDRLAQSEADASSLAAGQCIVTNGGLMGDDHGHLYCDMQRQRDELRGRIRVMADIMSSALDVMKTVEGDGSEEDEALMNIRAKMASAIDYVARRDFPMEGS